MLSKILGKVGLPILLKFIKSSLSSINGDIAQRAGSALADLNIAIEEKKISLDEIKEANRHIERMQDIERELDNKTLETINETIRQELSSNDKFVRFWRPAFGYCVSLAWLANMLTICYCVIADSEHAEEVIMAMVETTSLWGVALGVLGVSVVKRSQEKMNNNKEDIMSKIVNKVI